MDDTSRAPEPPVNWQASTPPPTPPRRENADVSDFLTFRAFITPAFVTVIWIIGAVVISLAAVAGMASPGGFVNGLILLLIGNLWWRIVMEIFIVLFRIHDSLASIERQGRRI